MAKKIIVQWKFSDHMGNDAYGHKEMRIISSDHEIYRPGERWDWELSEIVSKEGFNIEVREMSGEDILKTDSYKISFPKIRDTYQMSQKFQLHDINMPDQDYVGTEEERKAWIRQAFGK